MSTFSELRQKAGLSLSEAAVRTGFSERTAYRWETGETQPRRAVIKTLQQLVQNRTSGPANFTFIDLFAGIGGMRLGFETIGGRCIYTCERDKYSRQTYLANFPEDDHEIDEDINDIAIDSIPEHDVLLAGFPCQPFSIAGVSKKNALGRKHGFACDAQGTLFFRLAEIIRQHQPKAFLLENVKNLVSHDKRRTFEVIREVLTEELDYHIDFRVIDAKPWVPQHRERIFIAGFRRPSDFSFEGMELPPISSGPKLSSILHPEDGTEVAEPPYTGGNIGHVSAKYMLTDHLWKYLQDYAAKHKAKGNGFGFGLCGPEDVARTLSARYYKDGSEILIRRHAGNPRRLTPRECARLMGFQTDERDFVIPVSDTQAYKQFGNAVVVHAVEAVASHMEPELARVLAGEPLRKAG